MSKKGRRNKDHDHFRHGEDEGTGPTITVFSTEIYLWQLGLVIVCALPVVAVLRLMRAEIVELSVLEVAALALPFALCIPLAFVRRGEHYLFFVINRRLIEGIRPGRPRGRHGAGRSGDEHEGGDGSE